MFKPTTTFNLQPISVNPRPQDCKLNQIVNSLDKYTENRQMHGLAGKWTGIERYTQHKE